MLPYACTLTKNRGLVHPKVQKCVIINRLHGIFACVCPWPCFTTLSQRPVIAPVAVPVAVSVIVTDKHAIWSVTPYENWSNCTKTAIVTNETADISVTIYLFLPYVA